MEKESRCHIVVIAHGIVFSQRVIYILGPEFESKSLNCAILVPSTNTVRGSIVEVCTVIWAIHDSMYHQAVA